MAEESLSPIVDNKLCVVCVEEIDGENRLHALGPCNHKGVCSLCYLRLRQLMKEDTCVLCKTPMDKVMVCREEDVRPFEEFQTWGDNAGPDYDWDDKSRMFLPKTYNRSFVQPLQELRCGIENCTRPKSNSLGALEKHLREQHHRSLCKVCMKHRKVFLMEQQRYTNLELQQHIVSGDAKLGQAGHPRCEFCKTRYYDATALHEHLVKDHYSCHLCEKRGIHHKYYRDYTDLEKHFRSDHHLCEQEECLDKKFIVFADEIDFRAHMLQMHPDQPIGRKIQVNFKVKRSNWDGTGDEQEEQENQEKKDEEVHEWTYEGEIGGQSEPSDALAARREAARRAARSGGMVGLPAPPPSSDSAQEFPSLFGGDSRQASGWADLARARRPRAEDFPALHGTGRPQRGDGGGMSFRSAVEAYPTRAQEIAMSKEGEGEWCYDYPMPPEEQASTKGASATKGGRGGGAGGGGSRRVPGIGNMKLKADKKAGKKNKHKAGGGAGGVGGGIESDTSTSMSDRRADSQASPLPKQTKKVYAPVPLHTPGASPPPGPGMTASVTREQTPPPILANGYSGAVVGGADAAGGDATRGGGSGPTSVVAEMRELIGEEAFSEVKELSADYRSGFTMPGEYFKAMQERLPAERFGELFEGLVSILPDEDKRRELLVLLVASRSAKANAGAVGNYSIRKKNPAIDEPERSSVAAPTLASTTTLASKTPSAGTMSGSSKASGLARPRNNKPSKVTPPGSAATYLTAMHSKSGTKMTSTGISIVRPGGASGGKGVSRAANPRPRSESPPPGVPLRRRGGGDVDGGSSDGGTGILGTGASWATQGGSGFRGKQAVGAGGAGGKETRLNRDDFPGLVSSGVGGVSSSSAGSGGGGSAAASRSIRSFLGARSVGATPAQARPQRRGFPTGEDFPGLPTPSAAMPGMERVDWGGAAGQVSREGDGSTVGVASADGVGVGGGKSAKQKAKKKAEKDALKGMAFGFR